MKILGYIEKANIFIFQLNEVSEENKKMEIQAKRVQARLDNLQVSCLFFLA